MYFKNQPLRWLHRRLKMQDRAGKELYIGNYRKHKLITTKTETRFTHMNNKWKWLWTWSSSLRNFIMHSLELRWKEREQDAPVQGNCSVKNIWLKSLFHRITSVKNNQLWCTKRIEIALISICTPEWWSRRVWNIFVRNWMESTDTSFSISFWVYFCIRQGSFRVIFVFGTFPRIFSLFRYD